MTGKLRTSELNCEKTPSMPGRNGGRLRIGNPGNRGGGRPITHGRYSTLNHERLRELVAHFEADPDPLNVTAELALLRAIVVDFINRYDKFIAALEAWHESYVHTAGSPTEPKPTQLMDIAEVAKIVGQIARTVEQIQKMRSATAVCRADLFRIMQQMGAAVAQHVSNPAEVEAVREEWLGITLTR